jgi:dihydrofolate reductase
MKCFIIAAISTDGFIAKDENHAAMWTSKEDKKRFVELTKRAGVVVMGSRTFRTLPRPLKERVNIVYSKSKEFIDQVKGQENVEITQDEPKVLLEKLAARGFKEVAICGGAQIYTAFLKAHIVNSIYLTIEPILFGRGLTLFNEPLDHTHLELVSRETNPTGSILLEYKINYHGNM